MVNFVGRLRSTRTLFHLGLVALLPFVEPAHSAECRYNTKAEAKAAFENLKHELQELAKTDGFFDFFAAREGCARAIRQQAEEKLSALKTQLEKTPYPPDSKQCVQLTMAYDRAKSWVFQYRLVRSPHEPGTPKFPDVCLSGKLEIRYESACKENDPLMSVGIESKNAATLQSFDLAANEIKKTAPTPINATPKKPEAPAKSNAHRLDRKAIEKKELELVQSARDELKAGKMPGASMLAQSGELFIHSELHDASKKDYPKDLDSQFLDAWNSQVASYKKLFSSSAGKPIEDRLDELAEAINQDFTAKYDNRDDMKWNRPNTRLIDLLEGEGSNCQGAAKMNFAMLAAVVSDQLPPHLVPAVQMTGHHVAVVIYNKEKNEIWDMTHGGKPVPYTKGELYHGSLLLQADLSAHGNKTIKAEELLIARPTTPPSAQDLKVQVAKAGEDTGGLPASSYDLARPFNPPRYEVLTFSRRNVAVVDKISAATKEEPIDNFKDRSLNMLASPKTEGLLWNSGMSMFSNRMQPQLTIDASLYGGFNSADIRFRDQEDLDTYKKLKTPEQKREFLVSMSKDGIGDALDVLESGMVSNVLGNPEKWGDLASARVLEQAISKLHHTSKVLRYLSAEDELDAATMARYKKVKTEIFDTRDRLSRLAKERPEVLLRAMNSSPMFPDSSDPIINTISMLDRVKLTPFGPTDILPETQGTIGKDLLAALKRTPELRLGKGGAADYKQKPQEVSSLAVAPDAPPPAVLDLSSSDKNGVPLPPPPVQGKPKPARVVKKSNPSEKESHGFSVSKYFYLAYMTAYYVGPEDMVKKNYLTQGTVLSPEAVKVLKEQVCNSFSKSMAVNSLYTYLRLTKDVHEANRVTNELQSSCGKGSLPTIKL